MAGVAGAQVLDLADFVEVVAQVLLLCAVVKAVLLH
jgi:hypothetical protein